MQFSKFKATLESFLCEKLIGRVKINAAVYRKTHDQTGRVWISFDKQEILHASTITYEMMHSKVYNQLIEEKRLKPIPYNQDWKVMLASEKRKQLVHASDQAEQQLMEQEIFSEYDVYNALLHYHCLSIEQALNSDHTIVKAYAMFDRRLGKRKLLKLMPVTVGHPLIAKFYSIRCTIEGIRFNEKNLAES
ncbi:nonribosomal peptide synthetase [Radiobacillus sp. PE A8.2]|uniref:SF0329 family protein n=1 Tax=Radiobacillus sp. PE A8.2 TaxID=3380349 RepID=UPI003890C060